MKAALLTIVDELKRLRIEGVSHVNVSENTILKLKQFTAPPSGPANETSAKEALRSIPENIRSATVEDFNKVLAEKPVVKNKSVNAAQAGLPPAAQVVLPEGDKQSRWNALRNIVMNCPTCASKARDGCQVVFGVGNIDADIFFCGEAPGADEEVQGEPFVGKAGQLLNKMIKAMGLEREKVYIGNIMNWRPELPTRTGNRPPTHEEMAFCMPYLKAQVEVVKPKVIVALGATAAKGLLGQDSFRSLREVKGRWHDFSGTPVVVTYHPSYLLRNNSNRDKRSAWEDLLLAMEKVGMPISDRQRNFFL